MHLNTESMWHSSTILTCPYWTVSLYKHPYVKFGADITRSILFLKTTVKQSFLHWHYLTLVSSPNFILKYNTDTVLYRVTSKNCTRVFPLHGNWPLGGHHGVLMKFTWTQSYVTCEHIVGQIVLQLLQHYYSVMIRVYVELIFVNFK